jgi:dipeptidyl aminopeptidase/acylaminoacyl peptidase
MRRILIAFAAALALAPVAAAAAAVPDIAATVEAIARIKSASSPSWSPDGTQVAFISNASGSPQVWIVAAAGGAPRQVTRLADPVQSVTWSPAGDWLAYDVAPGGGLNVQVWLVHPDGTGGKLITGGGADNNRLYGWTDDGKRLAIGSAARNPAQMDAWLVDPATGARTVVVEGRGLNTVTDVSHDGRFALVSRLVSRGDNNIYRVDLASHAETLVTPHSGTASFGWGKFSPDGRFIYLTSDAAADLAVFGVVELATDGRPGPFRTLAARRDAEAEDAVMSHDGHRALLIWNVAGRSQAVLLDTAAGKLSAVPALPAELVRSPQFSPDDKRLVLVASGAAAPADLHVLDLAPGRFARLTESAHDGVDLAGLSRPSLVKYSARDGVLLSGWLYRPRGFTGPGPVVFLYHGGPEGESRPVLSDDIQALVAAGASVFAPNVRGSTGFGKKFVNLDNGPLRVNAVRDIEDTTNALVKLGYADPRRLGIMGGSYGGYMVMAGVTEYPDMFAAGADLYGVVNFESFFAHTQPWMAAISTVEYGDPVTQKDMLRALSPINRLDRVKTPLIVLHGANDTNVPVVEAEQIVTSLKARGAPVQYVRFPDEGHGWRKLANRVASTEAIVNFFGRHLGTASNAP